MDRSGWYWGRGGGEGDEDVFVNEVGCSFVYIDGGGTLYVNSGIGEEIGRLGGGGTRG